MSNFGRVVDRAMKNSRVFDRENAKDAVNQAYWRSVTDLGLASKKATITLTAGQKEIDISSTITDLSSIDFIRYGTGVPMQPVSAYDLLNVTDSAVYTGVPYSYALYGLDTLLIHPGAAAAGDTITIYYNRRPPALVEDSDEFAFFLGEFTEVIEDGASAILSKEEDANLAAYYSNKYREGQAAMMRTLNSRYGRIPQRIRVGYPTGHTGGRRNDVYP